MTSRLVRIIVVFMFFAMTGLVGIQIIWIQRAVQQREEQFDQGVFEALAQTTVTYQESSWQRDFDQSFNWKAFELLVQNHMDSLSRATLMADSGRPRSINRQRLQRGSQERLQFSISPFGGAEMTISSPETDSSRAAIQQEMHQTFLMLNQSRTLIGQLFRQMVADFSMNLPSEIDTSLLRHILEAEFKEHGIKTGWTYGLILPGETKFSYHLERYASQLSRSDYRGPLMVNPIEASPELVVYFPNKTSFLLRNLYFLLAASAVLILIIIAAFSSTIFIIVRQKKVQEIKNDLINNITHELKTPISTISLACQAIADPDLGKDPHTRDKYLGMISEENKRLGMLVENVLQAAVFERGEGQLKLRKVDMHQKINSVLRSLDIQIDNRKISVVKNLDAREYVVEADEVMVTNLIFNLADNAIKYSRKKEGNITVSTWNDEQGFFLEMADNGIGISKENIKRIFDKLYRVPTGDIHDVKGYGLGLSYVKKIVEAHQGDIQVKSQLQEGSRFIVRLPLKQEI
jgi:two-component system, OmpR family, phosphate regulon sensor histidine kinase PhoR